MFAPEGYTPLAELWETYREARLQAVRKTSVAHYSKPDFKQEVTRGSPLDICEYMFLKSISLCSLSVASHDGQVMKFSTVLKDGTNSILTVLPPVFALWATTAEKVEQRTEKETTKWGGNLFQSADLEQENFYADRYPSEPKNELEQFHLHHSLPICFYRRHFIIADKLPTWAQASSKDTAEWDWAIKYFAGWSLVLSDTALETWRPFLEGKSPIETDLIVSSSGPGRPRKRETAVEAFLQIYPSGTQDPWKEILRQIKLRGGVDASVETLKRGLEDAGIDSKTGTKQS